jgi:hypothetical protein
MEAVKFLGLLILCWIALLIMLFSFYFFLQLIIFIKNKFQTFSEINAINKRLLGSYLHEYLDQPPLDAFYLLKSYNHKSKIKYVWKN